jgi:acyl-CoA reductase-like NAD-dependent aldehyde dehydrogenase
MRAIYPYWLANRPVQANEDLIVTDKATGEVAARVALADAAAIDRAITAAVAAEEPMRRLGAWERREVLAHCVRRFEERRDELAEILTIEAGKPITDSRGEVMRLVDTFRTAAEEATRLGGDVMPLDISARAAAYWGMWKRVPVGACSFITPFNFPLNLVAHKIAPAIAAGCPFVLKPASTTPISALVIGEVLAETSLPEGAFSILPARREDADVLATDDRFALLSFTGSAAVGWDLKARAGKKKVILELGGNAACIVDADADLDDAVERLLIGAFSQSGQSCISVQRILAHRDVYDALRARLVARTRALVHGDPRDAATKIGPIISEKEAQRIEAWIREAVDRGARLLCGGRRERTLVQATLLENVPRDCKVVREEVFGPVAVLSSFARFEDAIDEVNDSRYGLQAGVFTRDLQKVKLAWDRLKVGGVVINDVPTFRVDHMPYGGVKDSGLGREGIRFAMEEMTEIRMLVVRDTAARGASLQGPPKG